MRLDDKTLEKIKYALGETALRFEEKEWGLLVRKKDEKESGNIERILVLKPGGYTGMNPHPKTDYAKIRMVDVFGVKNHKSNRKFLEYVMDTGDSEVLTGTFLSEKYGCGKKIVVVNKQGNRIAGYWHGVKNTSKKPLVLHLEKRMVP